jgi:hypothetical protein
VALLEGVVLEEAVLGVVVLEEAVLEEVLSLLQVLLGAWQAPLAQEVSLLALLVVPSLL